VELPPVSIKRTLIIAVGIVVFAGVLGFFVYGRYRYLELREINSALETRAQILERTIVSTRNNLAAVKKENADLIEALQSEQNKNAAFESRIREIAGTVGILQKLSKTDPELLKKYSKVYFLNENYAPAQLTAIDSANLYDKTKPQQIHAGVWPYLQSMIAAAARDGITLQIISAFRSFYEQASVKYGYKMTYGFGANQFSADQGYSEHQLGTAVDFTTPETKEVFSKFESSTAYKWLTENAYKFGFVLSYPKNNSYYRFEPWHWRFVSTALAAKLREENKYFYELTQREIDAYLITIFD
jgi:LAS superfamily LD-carboxypeptidase LdcB